MPRCPFMPGASSRTIPGLGAVASRAEGRAVACPSVTGPGALLPAPRRWYFTLLQSHRGCCCPCLPCSSCRGPECKFAGFQRLSCKTNVFLFPGMAMCHSLWSPAAPTEHEILACTRAPGSHGGPLQSGQSLAASHECSMGSALTWAAGLGLGTRESQDREGRMQVMAPPPPSRAQRAC